MSGNILCVIPIDRYIHVAHSRQHERIVTSKILGIIISMMVLISCAWAASIAFFKVKIIFFMFTACEVAAFMVGISYNIAILINVKSQTKNSSAPHTTLNASLTKTVSLIVGIMLMTYIPLIVHLNTIQYVFRNWTKLDHIKRIIKSLRWTMIASRLNAIFNSVIFITRNSRMKRYYYNLLNCRNNKERKRKTSQPATSAKTKRI